MRKITKKELKEVLVKHLKWLHHEDDGQQADLSEVDLSHADLSMYNLSYANLCYSNLRYADLMHTNLSHADLHNTDLSYANLRYTDLSDANLKETCLLSVNLSGSILSNADLYKAYLTDAILSDTILDEKDRIRKGIILEEDLKGYKQCQKGLIVELIIPKGSIVFSINKSKCRTNRAKVVSITDINGEAIYDKAVSYHDDTFTYEVGKEYEIENFNLMYNVECSSGIHFFRTRQEAVDYYLT